MYKNLNAIVSAPPNSGLGRCIAPLTHIAVWKFSQNKKLQHDLESYVKWIVTHCHAHHCLLPWNFMWLWTQPGWLHVLPSIYVKAMWMYIHPWWLFTTTFTMECDFIWPFLNYFKVEGLWRKAITFCFFPLATFPHTIFAVLKMIVTIENIRPSTGYNFNSIWRLCLIFCGFYRVPKSSLFPNLYPNLFQGVSESQRPGSWCQTGAT